MRAFRRSLAAAALAVLGLSSVVVPAWAHDEAAVHSVRWLDEQPDLDAPNDGQRLFSVDYVAAAAAFDDEIARWRIEMRPEAGGDPAFCDKTGPFGNSHKFRCNWDTTRLGDMSALAPKQPLGGGPVSPNGRYVITVTVWNVGRPQGLISREIVPAAHVLQPARTVIVENPVSPPTGVSRSYNSNTGRATVTWAPSPEPDIQKYIIQEKRGSGAWENIGERPHGSTSFDRQVPDVGTYQYRVASVRPEVAQSGWVETEALEVASPPAAPSSDPETPRDAGPEPGVTVLEPPPTATTIQSGAIAGPTGGPRPAGGGGSSLFVRPSASGLPRPSAPRTTPTTADTGYSEALPYGTPKKDTAPLDDPEELAGSEQPESMTRLITVPRPRDPRALLIPLAGGLAIFVFSMQVTFLVRRRPALAHIDDDFSDWTGI